jgi:peroxiredoxin
VANIPALKSLYAEHGARGFEIIGISLDEEIKDARRAVAEQGMSWPQVCDGEGTDSPVARRYEVQGSPRYVLINRSGAVAASYVRAGEIEQRLIPLLIED